MIDISGSSVPFGRQHVYKKCHVCKGRGYIRYIDWSQPVSTGGSRPEWTKSCPECGGVGSIRTEYFVQGTGGNR